MRDPFEPVTVPILEILGPAYLGRTRGMLSRRWQVLEGRFELLIVWLNDRLGPPAFAWRGIEASNHGVAHILSGKWVADQSWKSSLTSTALKRTDRDPAELRHMRIVLPATDAGGESRAQEALQALDVWRKAPLNPSDRDVLVRPTELGTVHAKPLEVRFM